MGTAPTLPGVGIASVLVPKIPNEDFAAVALCTVCENKEDEAVGLAGARWFFQNVAKLFEPLMAKNQLSRDPPEIPDCTWG